MSLALTFVILAFVVGCITRAIVLDTFWKPTRDRMLAWFEDPIATVNDDQTEVKLRPKWQRFLFGKFAELLGCIYCVSFWVAGLVVLIQDKFVDGLPAPIWWWLGLRMATIVVLEYTEGTKQVKLVTGHEH